MVNARAARTVLVADDNDGVRELVVMILGRRGWTTLEAADGHEAVHLIDRDYQTIDLLVTDIVMPMVWRIGLTFVVPFFVSVISSVEALRGATAGGHDPAARG